MLLYRYPSRHKGRLEPSLPKLSTCHRCCREEAFAPLLVLHHTTLVVRKVSIMSSVVHLWGFFRYASLSSHGFPLSLTTLYKRISWLTFGSFFMSDDPKEEWYALKWVCKPTTASTQVVLKGISVLCNLIFLSRRWSLPEWLNGPRQLHWGRTACPQVTMQINL